MGRTLNLEMPILPSGHLTEHIGVSTERRFPMLDKRNDTGYFLCGKCKELETGAVVLLEIFHSLFSSGVPQM